MDSSTHSTDSHPQPAKGPHPWYAWLSAIARMGERARTRKLLAQLDERQLADSGISHCDRAAELHKPFWRT
ncbi:DUF1127 domain-containing protein [Pseudomonas piscis]|uniref:DUF1127 domain-containing protein n=1 Tax=Pseudomonas piscis TaxID=2614538 RepID=UPI0038506DA6